MENGLAASRKGAVLGDPPFRSDHAFVQDRPAFPGSGPVSAGEGGEDDTVPLGDGPGMYGPYPGQGDRRPIRLLAAGVPGLIGLILIGYVLIQPAVREDRFGWEPVTEELRMALDAASTPAAPGDSVPAREDTKDPAADAGAAPGTAEASAGPDAGADAPAGENGLLDLNRASASDLQNLPGIGPAKADAIVEHREKYGPFRSVDDLLNVKGIGPKLLERMRPLVTVGGGSPAETP